MIPFLALALIALVAAAVAAALCVALRPLLQRYALARPNARSSHRTPTPQGGGVAVLGGIFAATAVAMLAAPMPDAAAHALAVVTGAAVLLAVVGAWDDIAPLPARIRLGLQAFCVGLVLLQAEPGLRLFPEAAPLLVERALALLAGVWFVNLVNFMDGLDWITVAGLTPLAGALALASLAGVVDPASGFLAAALCGGLLGFSPFNRPVARLFLGDVGSLPLGLLTAYLLYRLAGSGAWTAALILPLYHVMDATLTLLRRVARGERVWEAHRSHFYQQATVNGFSVIAIVGQVGLLNLALVGLAAFSVAWPALWAQAVSLLAAVGLTTLLLRRFSRKRPGHD